MKIKLYISVFFLVFSSLTLAENSTIEKGYEVHYNALSTSFLNPEVAKIYHIGRSKTKGFVNIAVLKQHEGQLSTSVEADINISAKNYYGQSKEVTLQKIKENDGAIYYIGTFPVSSHETIKFKAQVKPKDTDVAIDVSFDQEFFTN
jgi:hypothetical protein